MDRFKLKLKPVHAGVAAGLVAGVGAALILGQSPSAESATRQPILPSPSVSPSMTTTPTSTPTQASGPTRAVYTATLSPVNANSSAGVDSASGTVRIVIDGNRIGVDLQATGLAPGSVATPSIRTGTTCPSVSANDTNGDGFVDITEAQTAWGNVLVPLQIVTDLAANGQGIGFVSSTYPTANATDGSLDYINAGPFATISAQLTRLGIGTGSTPTPTSTATTLPLPSPSTSVSPGPSPSASVTPSPSATATGSAGQAAQYASMQGLVVGITGAGNATLPSSVVGVASGNATADSSLPVACGTLQQVTE